MTDDRALAEADAADALLRAGVNLGPLHGIPYGLKDLFDTKGVTTGWGAEPFRDRVPDTDATIVRKLRTAGAVLLGKTTVGAFAYNEIWYGGCTRNPWNLNEGSSGSSAGSASATAAGLCAFSIGTETLGSITSPCQRCGTTGLRPTFGRVSRAGAMALCWSLDKVGRSAGRSRTPPWCSPRSMAPTIRSLFDRGAVQFRREAGISGIKLGYLPEAFGEGANEVDRAALAAARRLGIEVTEVSLPDLPYGALMNILYAEAAAAFEELTLNDLDDTLTWQDDGAWPNTFRKARFLSAVDHVQLDRLRYRVMLALDELFTEVDAVIGPFMTGPMLIASNFTGHPCLHLRAGFLDLATRGAASLGSGKLTTGEPEAAGRTGSPGHFALGAAVRGRTDPEPRPGAGTGLGVAAERPALCS